MLEKPNRQSNYVVDLQHFAFQENIFDIVGGIIFSFNVVTFSKFMQLICKITLIEFIGRERLFRCFTST